MKKLLLPLLLSGFAFAAEPVELPLDLGTLTTTEGRVYEQVKVVGQDAVGIRITHAGGTARLSFDKLPKAVAERFPHDPAAAKQQRAAEAKAEAAQNRPAPKAADKDKVEGDDEAKDDDTPLEKAPVAKGDNAAQIASLNAYIRRLEIGIDGARTEITKSKQRAADYRNDANYKVVTTDSLGVADVDYRTNYSKIKKAQYHENRVLRYEEKVKQAERLVADARAKIAALEGQAKKS